MKNGTKIKTKLVHFLMLLSVLVPQFFNLSYLPTKVLADAGDFQVTQNSGGAFRTDSTTLQIDPEGDGTYLTLGNGATVADKTNVRMIINWSLDNDLKTPGILSTPTVFENLPSYFHIPSGGMSGTIYGQGTFSNTPFATYTITSDRKITLTWMPMVLSLDNVSGHLDINTWFEFSQTDTNETIDLGHVGGNTVTINPQPDGDAEITKTQTAYDKDTGIITWEVLVNEGTGQNQSLSNLIIKDDYGTDQEFVSAALSKKEKGASDWEALLKPSGYTEMNNTTNHEVTWTIQPQDGSQSRASYKVVVKTHITNPAATKFTNKASFKSGNDAWEDVNSGEFDVAQGTGVISKRLDEENGQDKIKYFKADGSSGTKADYAYALLYWTIKAYYPIDGSLNNPIEDALSVTPAGAGTHTYEQGSVVITPLNGQADALSFTKSFGTNSSGQATMTITPPQAPFFAKRNYQVTYTTRFTKDAGYMTDHPDQTIALGNHAKITGIGESGDGGYIVPGDEGEFGIQKASTKNPSPANHMTSSWQIRYNTTDQAIVNGKIVDSYILYRNEWEKYEPGTITEYNYSKYKWVYYKRELLPETLKVSTTKSDGTVDRLLVKDVDYTLKMRNLDDENLLLPDGTKLYAGLGYESGFEIQLLGAYKTLLSEDLLITFDAHESVSAYKGYLNSWDTQPNANANYDWPGLETYHDYWSHKDRGWMPNDLWSWDINPDLRFFNKVIGYWGENQENSKKDGDDVGTGWLEIYDDLNGYKEAFRVPEGYNFQGMPHQTVGGLDSIAALHLFSHVRKMALDIYSPGRFCANYSSDGAQEPPLYQGIASEEMVGFTTTFNAGQAPLPAGTVFSDDLSHLETADLGQNETSYHYLPGSVRVVESMGIDKIQNAPWHPDFVTIGRVMPEAIAQGAENRPSYDFIEGVDYEVQYDDQTKVLKVVFLKATNKTFNVIFLMTMSHDNPLGQDPLTNQNYKNIAKLTVLGLGNDMETSTEGSWGFETELVNKIGTLGTEEGEKDLATWQVQVNPSGYAFQQLLFTDEIDAAQTYLKDASGLPLINVYEAVKDGTGNLTKGQLLTAGTDYQLIPKNIAVSMGSKHFDENAMANMAAKKGSLPAYPSKVRQNTAEAKIFQYWNRDLQDPGEDGWAPMPVDGVNGTTFYPSYTPQPMSQEFAWGAYSVGTGLAEASYHHRISELGYRFFTETGGQTGYEANYGNNFTEARIKNTPDEYFQLTFGENRVYGDDEARDNRTFIVEYVTQVKAGATPSKLQNEATVAMWDQITIRQGEEVEHVYSSSGGGAQGVNFNLTLVKDDGDLEGVNPLSGARVRLEKKMGGDYQAIYPEGANALGEFDITGGQITREGLTQGYYRLTELQAPDGYQLLSEPVYFRLTAPSGQAVWQEVDDNGQVIDDPNFTFDASKQLILNNEKLKRDLTVEKQWDFSASNVFVILADLPYYVVKVDVYRDGTGQIGDTLPTKIASLELTQANDFKATVNGLPMTDITGTATYHYYAREVDIVDSRTGQSILPNFETSGGDDQAIGSLTIGSDTYDSANRIVNDSNSNFYIIMKNTVEERELGDYVKVGFKKVFDGDTNLINLIDHVNVELWRKTATSDYQYQTTVTLDASKAWQWSSGILDKEAADGSVYTYSIKEVGAYTSEGENLLAEFDSSASDYTTLIASPADTPNSTLATVYTTIVNQSIAPKLPVTGGPGFKATMIIMTLAMVGGVFLYRFRQQVRPYKHEAKRVRGGKAIKEI